MKTSFYKLGAILSLVLCHVAFADDSTTLSKGEYLARAGDCMACHTNDTDKPYAGGHGLASPIGTIYATNITPDKQYGIGAYSYEDFEKALRHGVKPSGDPLYPAMPFVSYAKMNDEDVRALYEYFMNEVQPVAESNKPTDIEWPLNMRFPMSIWNALFTNSMTYVSQPEKGEAWNRGAYLVQGLGHCGTCHTPRNITLVEQGLDESSATFLAGTELGGWYAPNLRTLNEKDDQELLRLLKDGRNTHHALAGPMAEVTGHSLSHLSDEDVNSMIVYLRSIQLSSTPIDQKANPIDKKSAGYIAYQDFCSTCHGKNGEGIDNIAPSFINRGSEQGRSINVAQVLLSGAETAHKAGFLPYEMPTYANKLSDEQIADITNFIMNNSEWQNHNQNISAKDVQKLRAGALAVKGWWFIVGGIVFAVIVLGIILRIFRKKK